MTKFTRLAIGDTIVFDHAEGMSQATITIVDESRNVAASRTLTEKQLMEMQSAIREVLNQLPTDP